MARLNKRWWEKKREELCPPEPTLEKPATPLLAEQPWRVGSRVPQNVYAGDRPIAQFHDADTAALVVKAVNSLREPETAQEVRRAALEEAARLVESMGDCAACDHAEEIRALASAPSTTEQKNASAEGGELQTQSTKEPIHEPGHDGIRARDAREAAAAGMAPLSGGGDIRVERRDDGGAQDHAQGSRAAPEEVISAAASQSGAAPATQAAHFVNGKPVCQGCGCVGPHGPGPYQCSGGGGSCECLGWIPPPGWEPAPAKPDAPDARDAEIARLRKELEEARFAYEEEWTALPGESVADLMRNATAEAFAEHARFKERGAKLDAAEAEVARLTTERDDWQSTATAAARDRRAAEAEATALREALEWARLLPMAKKNRATIERALAPQAPPAQPSAPKSTLHDDGDDSRPPAKTADQKEGACAHGVANWQDCAACVASFNQHAPPASDGLPKEKAE
jgi:hypothetical protein